MDQFYSLKCSCHTVSEHHYSGCIADVAHNIESFLIPFKNANDINFEEIQVCFYSGVGPIMYHSEKGNCKQDKPDVWLWS